MAYSGWRNATISNNFMFRLVMEKEEFCRPLVERILDIKIKSLKYIEAEKDLKETLASKGGRLDLYVVDEDSNRYDIEIQVDSRHKKYLGKRSRYYAALMDRDTLKVSKHYRDLNKLYVIFICTFDPFDANCVKYSFSSRCDTIHDLTLDDELHKIFINTKGDRHRVSRELEKLVDYIENGQVADEYTHRIDEEVSKLRTDDRREVDYMTYLEQIHEDAMFLAEEMAEKMAEERAVKLAEEKAVKLAEEKAVRLAEEKAQKMAQDMADERVVAARAEEKDVTMLSSLRSMMNNLHFSAEQAMQALDIPPSEYAKYSALI